MPFPQKDGGASSIYHTALGILRQKMDLKILAINTPKDWVDIKSIPNEFINASKFEYSIVDTRIKLFGAFLNLFTCKSYFVSRFYSRHFKSHLIEILKNNEFEIIQLEHLYMCQYIDIIRKYSKAKVVLRSQNVEFKLWDRILNNEINILKRIYLKIATYRLRKYEENMSQKVDGIITISNEDAKIFKEITPNTLITSIPMGCDFDKIKTIDTSPQYDNFPVFYHLGSMDWLPNIEGLKWFIEEVIPVIKAEFPDFQFRMAGKKMPAWFFEKRNQNLIVDGEVENSMEYQKNKAILIVPLLSGGGIRIKIIEGMAMGKTIISTSIGAEGISYTDQENILIANTKEEFLAEIRKCIRSVDFCKKIGFNAKELAKEKFDCNSSAKEMISFYQSIINK